MPNGLLNCPARSAAVWGFFFGGVEVFGIVTEVGIAAVGTTEAAGDGAEETTIPVGPNPRGFNFAAQSAAVSEVLVAAGLVVLGADEAAGVPGSMA